MASFSKTASGNIPPSRFVRLTTTVDGQVTVCAAGEKVYGISQPGTRRTPYGALDDGFAAIAGENLMIFGLGQKAPLELGGTVSTGDRLKAGTLGVGVTTTTNLDEYGAIAMMAGTTGQIIEVLIEMGQISS